MMGTRRIFTKKNIWPLQEGICFQNAERVHPMQQRKVQQLLEAILPNPSVQRIIVFGSSITDLCHPGSDVDVYVERRKDEKLISTYLPFTYDLWTNDTVEPGMQEEILRKGVVVYGGEPCR